ncbi:sodium:solute symporter [Mycobacterium sp. 21AC1]|uniref:sodium:solute symporter n=1 Tax=[Mycobacterium] appelbergii TaxID=2939269 RepID=UPI0029394B49|nr:sodium:solute symporter [Mycobacterium sp. 21AC1]MDV3127967.1 sodium:solute symporter [Mycobacterium sp. 21AC1]
MGKPLDIAIVVIYLVAMLAFGFWGKTRTKDSADFLVAGRRLGPALYTGTMAAVVLGGASTVGGVGLGYKWGISGMWLVVAIAVGLLALSLLFAGPIQRLRVYTVAQMLSLRYGVDATSASGVVMAAYTLMLSVTSTIAYATVFNVLFGTGRTVSVVIGGAVVMLYSSIGGMWSITLTDMVQFVLKTIGVFFLLLPFTWNRAGGLDGIRERAGDAVFSFSAIGTDTIITFFVVYSFGMLIGQDIWQRVFTARSPQVAKWGGTTAALYCVLYGIAGALIGMAASTFLTDVEAKDDVYAQIAEAILPVGISGLVLAAAVAAMMSTASGALIATATVARTDIKPLLLRLVGRKAEKVENAEVEVHSDRRYVAVLGILVIVIAALLNDVVGALTIAYDILVGGLLVPILGGFLWKRATGAGALVAMAVGTVVTLGTMAIVGDVLANEPIYYGLATSLIAYVAVSLATARTPAAVLKVWDNRLAGRDTAEVART